MYLPVEGGCELAVDVRPKPTVVVGALPSWNDAANKKCDVRHIWCTIICIL